MNYTKKIEALALEAFNQSVQTDLSNMTLASLLTSKEKIQIGRRILIAQAILAGKTRYEINNHLSVSPNTYTQIRRWLGFEFQEYASAYKVKPARGPNTRTHTESFTYAHLKQKYPAHFLLFSLVEKLFAIKK